MIVYAESSAVLAWLLGEPRGLGIRDLLASAEVVLTSTLTLIECDRVLLRAVAAGLIPEADAAGRRAALALVSEHWVVFGLDAEVVTRARQAFPAEPIRSLDAIHLATVAVTASLVPDLAVVALDERVRRAGRQMGFRVLPED